jgi:hypothetical protein
MMLTDVIDAYLAKQRSLGMRFESAGDLLRRFCRAMGNPEIDEVSPETVAEFLHGRGALSPWHYYIPASFLGFSMSAEPPESVVPSASLDLHGCMTFGTRRRCIG